MNFQKAELFGIYALQPKVFTSFSSNIIWIHVTSSVLLLLLKTDTSLLLFYGLEPQLTFADFFTGSTVSSFTVILATSFSRSSIRRRAPCSADFRTEN